MTRRLILGTLVVCLSVCGSVAGAQAQGPGRGEVPSELWRKYPLKEPRKASRDESGPRQARHVPAARATDRERSDGGNDTTIWLATGLVLLAASAAVATAAWRGVTERIRRGKRAPYGKAGGSPRPGRPRAQNGIRATPGSRVAAIRSQRLPALESGADRALAQAALDSRTAAPPRPRPAGTSAQWSRRAPGSNGPTHASLKRQSALGYASVAEEGDTDGSMRRQQREIEEVCSRKGLALLKLVRDVESRGGADLNRPGLGYALERLAAHDASCLVVSSLERLTRSAANLGALIEWLDRSGARLVVVDIDLDTGTPEGRLGAKALAAVGGCERKTLRQRTRKGLEAARLAGRSAGQPAVSDRPALKQRIAEMRASGMTLQAIADTLNAEGIPTVRGGLKWRPSSVQAAAGYKRPNRRTRLA
jgi:DNA invertase Pin-like site-specific DNA recombinase